MSYEDDEDGRAADIIWGRLRRNARARRALFELHTGKMPDDHQEEYVEWAENNKDIWMNNG